MKSMVTTFIKKSVFLLHAVCFLQLCGAGYKMDKDGTLRDSDGSPCFFAGTVIGSTAHSGAQDYGKDFRGCYPEKFRWMYESVPTMSLMKKLGFNTATVTMADISPRILIPEYDPADPIESYIASMRRRNERALLSKGSVGLKNQLALLESMKDSVFFCAARTVFGGGNALKSKLLPQNHFITERWKSHPWNIGLQLGNPAVRKIWIDLYLDQVRLAKSKGVYPLGWRVITEHRWQDGSQENRERFIERLKKRYGTVEKMNSAWGTNFRSFNETLTESKNGKFFPAPVEVEFIQMEQEQISAALIELHNAIKKEQPESVGAIVQILGGSSYRKVTNNINLYQISDALDCISSGTANFTFSGLASGYVPDRHFKDTPAGATAIGQELMREAFARRLARGKFWVNLEAYCAGVPYTKNTFNRVLWRELATGHGAVTIHSWEGLFKADPANKFPVEYHLQNPNAVPPAAYDGVREMMAESKPLLDFFAVRKNWQKAQAAVLFSYPTVILDHAAGTSWTDALDTAPFALTFQHYPYDVVFEEELVSGALNDYKVLFAFGVNAVYPETSPALKKFVENGGTLVIFGPTLMHNCYGKKLDAPLCSGVELKHSPNAKRGKLKSYDVFLKPDTYYKADKNWTTLADIDGKSVFIKRNLGKGKIYALTGTISPYALAWMLREPLAGLTKLAKITTPDGKNEVPNIEVIRKSSGDLTGWYLSNTNTSPVAVQFSAPELYENTVINPLEKESYPVKNGGVTLLLPPGKRFVMVSGKPETVKRRFGSFKATSPEAVLNAHKKACEAFERNSQNLRPSVQISIADKANAGFDNQQSWTTDTIFAEKERKHFRDIPFHTNPFGDLMFDIVRFDFNENKTCIALKSQSNPSGIDKVTFPLSGRFSSLALLLTGTHVQPGEFFCLQINYENGKSVNVPVISGKDFGSWLPGDQQAKPVWKNSSGERLYRYEWFNPDSGSPISSFSLLSGKGKTVPVICAISAVPSIYTTTYNSRYDLKDDFCCGHNQTVRWNGNVLRLEKGDGSIVLGKGKKCRFPMSKLKNAVLRFSIRLCPDENGAQLEFDRICFKPVGTIGGKPIRISPHAWSRTGEGMSSAVKGKRCSAEWHEVEYSLYIPSCTKGTDQAPLEVIHSFYLQSQQKAPAEITNLRIEWNDDTIRKNKDMDNLTKQQLSPPWGPVLEKEAAKPVRCNIAGISCEGTAETVRIPSAKFTRERFFNDKFFFSRVTMTNTGKDPIQPKELVSFQIGSFDWDGVPDRQWMVYAPKRVSCETGRVRKIAELPDRMALHNTGLVQEGGADYGDPFLLLTNGKRVLLVGFIENDRQLAEVQIRRSYDHLDRLRTVSFCDNMQLFPGESVSSQLTVSFFADTAEQAITDFLELMKKHRNLPEPRRTPFVASSWHYYGLGVSEETVEKELEAIKRRKIPVDVYQIDGGWAHKMGDWDADKQRFPHGMKYIADKIRSAGLRPGLWFGSFQAARNSKIMQEHPEWVLYRADGNPVVMNCSQRCYVLDISQKAVRDHIAETFRKYVREYGFAYIKNDFTRRVFLHPDAVPANPRWNFLDMWREGTLTIREAIGKEAYFLNCGGHPSAGIGVVDSLKGGHDSFACWQLPYDTTKDILESYASRFWETLLFHPCSTALNFRLSGKLWENVPLGYGVLRLGLFSDIECRTVAAAAFTTGGLVQTGDPLSDLPEDRLLLQSKVVPSIDKGSMRLNLWDKENSVLFFRKDLDGKAGKWNALTILNLQDFKQPFNFSLSGSNIKGLEAKEFAVVDMNSFEFKGIFQKGSEFDCGDIEPHGSRVLLVFPLPETEKVPFFIASDIHYSGGADQVSGIKLSGQQLEVTLSSRWHKKVTLLGGIRENGVYRFVTGVAQCNGSNVSAVLNFQSDSDNK